MKLLTCVLALALTFFLASPSFAQVDRATLTGVVRDASNAVIPAATVKVMNIATGVAQTVTVTAVTGASGSATSSLVTVTIFWTVPGSATTNSYVVTAQIK